MKLAFELITGLPVHFAPHHKFNLYLKKDDVVLKDSLGEDTFDYNGMLLADYPVTGTGRKVLHSYEPGLTIYQGTPACPIEVLQEDFKGLSLWLDNNSIMSQGELQTYYRLKVYCNDREFSLPLLSPLMKVYWEGQGLFLMDLASLDSLIKR